MSHTSQKWLILGAVALALSIAMCAPVRGADIVNVPRETLTMSATWAIATPTPVINAPALHRVWLPVGGTG